MDYTILDNNSLFKGVSEDEIERLLSTVPHQMRNYKKGETVFHLMEDASKIGILLSGRLQAQKPFPNGSQVNVSIFMPGDLVGAAAVFSNRHQYPCDIVSLDPSTMLLFHRNAVFSLLQKDLRILTNFTTEIATTTYMLQQRLELLSYNGIAQKTAFYLLMQQNAIGLNSIPIPESMTKWALLMNVSRPSLHRELKKLEEEGILCRHARTIEILDAERLKDLLGM